MTTYTAEQIIRIGGREWQKNSHHRVYINGDVWTDLIGLKVSRYGSGNISSATLDDEPISNARAGEIINAVRTVYLDVADGRIHIESGYRNRYTDRVPGWIRDAIAEQVAATEPTLTTREAADKLGVSIRTIQRRAQSGKLTARKDDRGHWIITL